MRAILELPAFQSDDAAKERKYLLPDTPEYNIMRVCYAATSDAVTAREWYHSVPLSEVYQWIAVRLGEVTE